MKRNKQLNRKIFNLDKKYKNMIRKIISNTLKEYNGIPIDWEDIYWEFLVNFADKEDKYNSEVGIKKHTYVGIHAKNFTKNKCRKYSTKKHRVMNNYIALKDYNGTLKATDSNANTKTKIDISSLNKFEVKVFKYIFIEGLSLRKAEEKLSKSRYYISMSIEKIKEKLYSQLEKLV